MRQNPAMFVGDTSSRGLHHIVYEVLDNSVDEFMAGHCDEISVLIDDDGSVTVEDNGRGYPEGIHPIEKKPTIEVILTTLHAGGKFDSQTYKVSGGLHGVGVSCTNALSEYLNVEVFRNNKTYSMSFNQGEVADKLKTTNGMKSKTLSKKTGTKIHFFPDGEIFSTTKLNYDTIKTRLVELSYLNAGLKIKFQDNRKDGEKEVYHNSDGIQAYIKELNSKRKPLYTSVFYCAEESSDESGNILVNVALQHNQQDGEYIYGFANNIRTVDGGTHVSGLRNALTRVINQYAIDNNKLEKGCERLDSSDIREGVCAIISVYLSDPKFEGQTKGKLTNTQVNGLVSSIFGDKFRVWLDKHSSIADKIVKNAIVSYNARNAAKKAASLIKKQASLEKMDLPGKLKNCRTKNPKERELFIVEGNSAGGNAEAARDSEFQAILPLRGKILNTEKTNLEKMLKNAEIGSLIKSIGTGIALGLTKEGDNKNGFDIEKLNFHKIIITTDADVDGAHIRVLLLDFFFRYMRPLIENGHIWIAKPPLFKVALKKSIKWSAQEGKEIFLSTDTELKEFMDKHADLLTKDGIQRFKGLGELNADQLAQTTMEKETRVISQITMADFDDADSLFHVLLGNNVSVRYDYIKEHSSAEYNIDI